MTHLHWIGPLCLCRSEAIRVPLAVPGVYLLHAFAPAQGCYPVFYVGKSSDLRRRLLEHLDDRHAKRGIRQIRHVAAAYFSAAAVLHPDVLDSIEAGLILGLEPLCNQQIPTAAPLLVNLPPLKALLP